MRNAEATKNKLLDAMRACIIEQGYSECTVKKVAELAGVNHGLVHHYFGSKERLVIEMLEKEAEVLRKGLYNNLHPAEFQSFFQQEMVANKDRVQLISECLVLSRKIPELGLLIKGIFQERRKDFGRVFNLKNANQKKLVFAALFGLAVQGLVDDDLDLPPVLKELLGLLNEFNTTAD